MVVPKGEFVSFSDFVTKSDSETASKVLESLEEVQSETDSKLSGNILDNFDKEIFNFIQVCPNEMLDKLDYPISLKEFKSKSA